MEKRIPHYELNTFKQLFRRGATRMITTAAQTGAAALGLMDEDDIQSVVSRLYPEHFYKSMTAHHSHKIWQDVYRSAYDDMALYIKLQLSLDSEKAVLIQLKKDQKSDA